MSEVKVLSRVERGRTRARAENSAALERYPRVPWPSQHAEGRTTSDMFVDGTSCRGYIKVIGTSDYFALWIDDGSVDVRVPLTPASARVLAELLLAISSPERKHTPLAV